MNLSRSELKDILYGRIEFLSKHDVNLFVQSGDVEEIRVRLSGIEEALVEIEKGFHDKI